MGFLVFANYYRELIKGYADEVYPMQQIIRHKGKKFTWNIAAEESLQRIKRSRYPGYFIKSKSGMIRLSRDHKRSEAKFSAARKMFAIVPSGEKYRAHLDSEPIKLRVDNKSSTWLKTYSMDQS